jgi:uncharacterized protein (DUF1499 family)
VRSVLWLVAFVAVVGTGGIGISLVHNAPPWSEPPGFGARLQAYLNTHVAETIESSAFPELRPRHYDDVLPDHLYGMLEQVMARLPRWQVVERNPTLRTIKAVVATQFLGFRDDVSIRVIPGADKRGSILFVASESRVGRGDLGANTRHLLDLYAALDTVVPPPPTAFKPAKSPG